MACSADLVHWSTDAEEARHRVDLYASTVSSALSPMQATVPGRGDDFFARMSMVDLSLLSFARIQADAHRCYQDKQGAARAPQRNYHLLINLASPWELEHRDRFRMEPGDAVVIDSALPWDIHSHTRSEYLNLTLSEGWIRQWLPAPGVLIGRRISGESGWGHALAAFASQLTPEFVASLAIPQSLVLDHVGALLAMSASELGNVPARGTRPAMRSLRSRIGDCIGQRCAEPALTSVEVASAIGVSVRTLHRCLAAAGETFSHLLTSTRLEAGMRMLESRLLSRLTVTEIALRAGFCDASHFERVVRTRTGRTPSQLRRVARPRDTTEVDV